MNDRADEAKQFLLMPPRGGIWCAVSAAAVERIESASQWQEGEPTDLHATFGLPVATEGTPERIVLLRSGEAGLPVKAAGVLAVEEFPSASIYALPWELEFPAPDRIVRGVILSDEERPVLVLDPACIVARVAA